MKLLAKCLALAALAAFLPVGCGKAEDAAKAAKEKADKIKADADKAAKEKADKIKADADKAKADIDKAAKEKADKVKADADKVKADADKVKAEAEKLGKDVTDLKATADKDLTAIEAKIKSLKDEADKAPADKKKELEAKVTDANGLLAKIKEQVGKLGDLKDVASFNGVKEKVLMMIADLKKKVGL